jgi:hypothetical protein|tara:strand:+ start:453 stop:632 length:180 start_codon:yes stop_codon:yes gene_type:complete
MKKKSQNIINQIQKIRSKNNIYWMKLLSLALEYAPEKSKKVLREINKNDKKVSNLVSKL